MIDTGILSSHLSGLWVTFSWQIALSVFLAYVIVDMLYAKYTLLVNQLRPAVAATAGALMYFLLAVGVLNYANNALYLVPLAIGSWVGTYFTVERERKKSLRK